MNHPDPVVSTTQEIRSINREALNNDAIKAVVDSHKERLRDNGEHKWRGNRSKSILFLESTIA